MRQIKEQVGKMDGNKKTLDAIMAAGFCLMAQSSLLQDGLMDYMTMMRGHRLLDTILGDYRHHSIFLTFTEEIYARDAASLVRDDQRDDLTDLNDFNISVQALGPLIEAPYEQIYYNALAAIYPAFQTATVHGTYYSSLFVVAMALTESRMAGLFLRLHLAGQHGFRPVYAAHRPGEPRCEAASHPHVSRRLCAGKDMPGARGKEQGPSAKDTIIGWARSASANVPAKYKEYTVWIDYYCQKLESTDDCRHLFTP